LVKASSFAGLEWRWLPIVFADGLRPQDYSPRLSFA
jgi:hypothetical protein